MNTIIPQDAVLLLSGAPCVGKTTLAYALLQKTRFFRRVGELDIIRTIIRATLNRIALDNIVKRETIEKEYSDLFTSITSSNYSSLQKQSRLLLPYIKEIIERQQRRSISTIIEGAGIMPSLFFDETTKLPWINKSVVVVNLFISDIKELEYRRNARLLERNNNSRILSLCIRCLRKPYNVQEP